MYFIHKRKKEGEYDSECDESYEEEVHDMEEEEEEEEEHAIVVKERKDISPLNLACVAGDINEVKKILASYPSSCIDLYDPVTRRNPMEIACEKGNEELVSILLSHGSQWKPIRSAVESGSIKIVKLLLEKGTNVKETDERGHTFLHTAATNGSLEIVKMLLAAGADPHATSKEMDNSEQAIHIAARGGFVEIVSVLMQRGVKVDVCDRKGNTPLLLAVGANTNSTEMVKLLLSKGADVNATNKLKSTPLVEAVGEGNLEVVNMLLHKGANAKDSRLGKIAYKSNLPVLQAVVKYGAKLPEDMLWSAAEIGNAEIVDWLDIKSKKIVDQRELGNLVSIACTNGHLELLKLLVLKKRASISSTDTDETPLQQVCGGTRDNVEMVQWLVENGADVNVGQKENSLYRSEDEEEKKKDDGFSGGPLKRAVRRGHLEIIRYLIQQNTTGGFVFVSGLEGDKIEVVREMHKKWGKGSEKEMMNAQGMALKQLNVNVLRFLIEKNGLLTAPKPQHGRLNFEDLMRGRLAVSYNPATLNQLSKVKGSGRKKVEIGELLLRHGAPLEYTGNDYQTPLALAVRSGSIDLVWLYTVHGADMSALAKLPEREWKQYERDKRMWEALVHVWNPSCHFRFPREVRDAITCVLLIAKRQQWPFGTNLMHEIFAFVAHDWIPNYMTEIKNSNNNNSNNNEQPPAAKRVKVDKMR